MSLTALFRLLFLATLKAGLTIVCAWFALTGDPFRDTFLDPARDAERDPEPSFLVDNRAGISSLVAFSWDEILFARLALMTSNFPRIFWWIFLFWSHASAPLRIRRPAMIKKATVRIVALGLGAGAGSGIKLVWRRRRRSALLLVGC